MAVPLTLYIIAGEASGDRLGASLMAGMKSLHPDTIFHGVGGPLMQSEGLTSLFPMSELSIMGLVEILPKLPGLFRRARQTTEAILALKPDALITIDAPEFCLRVAGRVKKADPGQKTIHYVAPSVWAWRPERATKMALNIDHVLALLPFEPPYMQAAGMSCDFVGHPVAADPLPTAKDVAGFRKQHGIGKSDKLMVVLPGSRNGEVSRMAPVFRDVMAAVLQAYPDMRYVVPVTRSVEKQFVEDMALWPGKPIILLQSDQTAMDAEVHKRCAFAAADLALAASGTVSLELAAANTPMVIAYKLNWLTTRIVRKKVQIDTATLVNILTESRVVPEFLLEDCHADAIAACVLDLLANTALQADQLKAAQNSIRLLGQGGENPGLRAAKSVLSVIDRVS